MWPLWSLNSNGRSYVSSVLNRIQVAGNNNNMNTRYPQNIASMWNVIGINPRIFELKVSSTFCIHFHLFGGVGSARKQFHFLRTEFADNHRLITLPACFYAVFGFYVSMLGINCTIQIRSEMPFGAMTIKWHTSRKKTHTRATAFWLFVYVITYVCWVWPVVFAD